MKRLVLSLAAIVLLCVGFSAPTWAITIQAKLDSFESRSATIAGVGSGGGFGSFTVVSPPAATGDAVLDGLLASGNNFLAMCLEPDQNISSNQTYEFEIVALRDAPTSSAAGPMGISGETWIERIIALSPHNSLEEVKANTTVSRQLAFQAALYEAGYESPATAAFNFNAGSAIVTTAAALPDVTVMHTRANNFTASTDLVSAYGLLNVARLDGPASRTVYTGQDFMVFTRTAVPTPGPLALMGLGLAGLGFTRLRKS